MTSEDPHKCCKSGHVHKGNPTGTFTTLAGIETYVAKNPNSNGKAVLYVTDALGYKFVNNQLLADTYAEQAEVDVYMPDFLEGDAVPTSVLSGQAFDFMPWLGKHNREKCYPLVEAAAKELRETHGVTKLASVGFCWGAATAIMLGATDLVDAVVLHHPTRLEIPGDVEKLKKPILFNCAEIDSVFPDNVREQTQQFFANKPDQVALFNLYPGTVHGFAVRGSDDPVVVEAKEDAKNQAVKFFKTYLA